MFQIELIICIKMDLALNNLQSLLCLKIQPTNLTWLSCFLLTGTNLDGSSISLFNMECINLPTTPQEQDVTLVFIRQD